MSEIRINKIQSNVPPQDTKKVKEDAQQQKELAPKPEVNHKPADEVLDYMANQAMLGKASVKSKKMPDVNKYVDEASQKRIEQVMIAFEANILKTAEVAIQEFGLSEKAATDAAIVGFGRKYLA